MITHFQGRICTSVPFFIPMTYCSDDLLFCRPIILVILQRVQFHKIFCLYLSEGTNKTIHQNGIHNLVYYFGNLVFQPPIILKTCYLANLFCFCHVPHLLPKQGRGSTPVVDPTIVLLLSCLYTFQSRFVLYIS